MYRQKRSGAANSRPGRPCRALRFKEPAKPLPRDASDATGESRVNESSAGRGEATGNVE